MRYALCQSHRARAALKTALSRDTQCYYTMLRDYVYGIIGIEESEVVLARRVKGVTVITKNRATALKLNKCWTS